VCAFSTLKVITPNITEHLSENNFKTEKTETLITTQNKYFTILGGKRFLRPFSGAGLRNLDSDLCSL
jgi:hypothetical protein